MKGCPKQIFLCLLLIAFALCGIAQETENPKADKNQKKPEPSNFVFGGNFSLGFGSATFVDISPIFGYYLKPPLLIGVGATYQYLSENYLLTTTTQPVKVSSNIFGFRSFVNYTFLENIGKSLMSRQNFGLFVHAEYEALNLDHDFSNTTTSETNNRFWINGILLGGGIKQSFGERSSFNISVLYNILATKKTPYDNPVIRIGFLF